MLSNPRPANVQAETGFHKAVITFPTAVSDVLYTVLFNLNGLPIGTGYPNTELHSPYTLNVRSAAVSAPNSLIYGTTTTVTAGASTTLQIQVRLLARPAPDPTSPDSEGPGQG